jgi:hypothetical protein
MSDDPKDPAPGPAIDETPIERALRLKQAALRAKPKPPGGGKFKHDPFAGVAAGASKPWMKK